MTKNKRESPCPICDGSYEVHGIEGAKPVHAEFPNILIARSDNHWMFSVWLRGKDGKTRWVDWIPERGLDSYIRGLFHARMLQKRGGL